MATVVFQDLDRPKGVRVPDWIRNLAAFNRWAEESRYPEMGRFSFLEGKVWVDLSMDELLTHNLLKMAISSALFELVAADRAGYLFGDRARLSNSDADISVEPDVMFASYDSIRSGRATLVRNARRRVVRLEGTPDIVVEVVSDSSVDKDLVQLRADYFAAGVPEYWIADAREDAVKFEMLKRRTRGYVSTRPQPGGWLKSAVFSKSFRITQTLDPLDNPQFTLEHRD
jgi:Uma2 family endonuclease